MSYIKLVIYKRHWVEANTNGEVTIKPIGKDGQIIETFEFDTKLKINDALACGKVLVDMIE